MNNRASTAVSPIKDSTGDSEDGFSCFTTDNTRISATSINDKLIIEANLGKVFFVHCVLLVHNLYKGIWKTDHENENEFFRNYKIYIGTEPNHTGNSPCPGGPFMQRTDSNSFGAHHDGSGTPHFWKYGSESWCNMEGQYVHIVADFKDTLYPTYIASVCSIGVLGTLYERVNAAPSLITLNYMEATTFTIEHI